MKDLLKSLCNLQCVFCQNWSVSQRVNGQEVEASDLAALMLALQKEGLDELVSNLLNIWSRAPSLDRWRKLVDTLRERGVLTVALVGRVGRVRLEREELKL